MAAAEKPRSLADQAGVLALGRLLAVLGESLMMLIIVRLIGKAEVGAFTAVLLVYQTAVLIARAGFPAATTFYVTGRPQPERRAITLQIVRTLVLLGVLCGVALAGIAGAATLDLFEDSRSLLALIVLAPLPMLELPTLILPNLLVLEGKARAAAGVSTVRSLGFSFFLLTSIAATGDLWVVAASLLVFGVLYFLLFLYLLKQLYGGCEKQASPVGAWELIRYGVPLGLTDMVSIVNNRVDRYLILGAFSASRFAEYQVGAFQVPFITNVPYDVGTVLAPRLRTLFAENKAKEAIDVWRQSIGKVSLLVVPVTMAFLVGAEEFIGTLFPSEYAASANVFRFYTLLSLGRVAAFGTVIAAAGAPRYVFYASLVAVGGNIAVSVPLLMTIGFLGPAIGTAIAFIPNVVAYCYYIARAAGLRFRQVFPLFSYLRVLFLTLLAALPALAVKQWLDAPDAVKFITQGVLLLLTFSALGSATGLIHREDWGFVLRWLKLKPARSG